MFRNINSAVYKRIIIFIAGLIVSFVLWKIISRIFDENAFVIIMEILYPVGNLYQ